MTLVFRRLFRKENNKKSIILINLLFYIFTIPCTSQQFQDYWALKDTYDHNKNYDAVILLLGVTDYKWYIKNPDRFRNYYRFNNNVDRVFAAVNIVKSGQGNKLLLGDLWVKTFNETEIVKAFALDQGIPAERIKVYGKADSTVDEASGVKKYLKENKIKNLLLITSEIHMRRALATFKSKGLFPDIQSVQKHSSKITTASFIPSISGISGISQSLYELYAYIGYYFTLSDF